MVSKVSKTNKIQNKLSKKPKKEKFTDGEKFKMIFGKYYRGGKNDRKSSNFKYCGV